MATQPTETHASAKTEEAPRYIEGIGRRKRATARVRIYPARSKKSVEEVGFEVNEKTADEYFVPQYQARALMPLRDLKLTKDFEMTVRVSGGGVTAQAEAVRMGLARALVEDDPSRRTVLKHAGYLMRDPREKERKKYGLKKARRAPQFSKR